jgi:hypothetical protein
LRYDDELLQLGNREITSPNAFKNMLGTYPIGWRVPMTFRRDGEEFQRRVRLAGVHRDGELEALLQQEHEPPVPDRPPGRDEPQPPGGEPRPNEPPKSDETPRPGGERRPSRRSRGAPRIPKVVRPFYEAAPGYANYWFNRHHQQRVWNAYLARGDFAETPWNWQIAAQMAGGGDVSVQLSEKSGTIVMPDGKSEAEFGPSLTTATSPPRSGGLLAALHLWQRLVLVGPQRFGEVSYLGTLPWTSDTELSDCLLAIHGGVETRFYFNPTSGDLIGMETQLVDGEDPCEIYFDDIRAVDGRSLPHHWIVRHGDEVFAEMTVKSYDGIGTQTKDSE